MVTMVDRTVARVRMNHTGGDSVTKSHWGQREHLTNRVNFKITIDVTATVMTCSRNMR